MLANDGAEGIQGLVDGWSGFQDALVGFRHSEGLGVGYLPVENARQLGTLGGFGRG